MLTLYHSALSPCAQKVRLSLHEKALAYEAVALDLKRKQNLEPAYMALNPNGVVPTLVDDGCPVIESTIISEYIEDRFPEKPLRPADPRARAQMRLWTKRVDDKIHPAAGVLIFAAFLAPTFVNMDAEARAEMLARLPDPARRERQMDLIEKGLDSSRVPGAANIYRRMADDIQAATMEQPWLLGDQLTLADFAVAPYVRGMETLGLKSVFEARPALANWFGRMKGTVGYQGGIAAYDPPDEIERRTAVQSTIAPKLEVFF